MITDCHCSFHFAAVGGVQAAQFGPNPAAVAAPFAFAAAPANAPSTGGTTKSNVADYAL